MPDNIETRIAMLAARGAMFSPDPFKAVNEMDITPVKWEDTPKAERYTDPFLVFMADRYKNA